jgi:hypothetical protein
MISEIFNALRAGKELKDPAKWKNRQETTNLVGTVLAGIVYLLRMRYPDIPIPDVLTQYGAEAIGAVLLISNLYFTRATTKKIGI